MLQIIQTTSHLSLILLNLMKMTMNNLMTKCCDYHDDPAKNLKEIQQPESSTFSEKGDQLENRDLIFIFKYLVAVFFFTTYNI